MSDADGRQVVLGVSGGIAAYKACELLRLLTGLCSIGWRLRRRIRLLCWLLLARLLLRLVCRRLLLLFFAAQLLQNPLDSIVVVLLLIALRHPRLLPILLIRVVFVSQERAQQAAGQIARLGGGRQQILQPHAGNGLQIGRNVRAGERAGQNYRDHQFAVTIGQGRGH